MKKILGHELQRAALRKLVLEDRIPSALLFSGVSGIGKFLVAEELARTMLCQVGGPYGGCGECRECHVFDSGNHPDFRVVDCNEKGNATVSTIRGLLYSLNLHAFGGRRRVVILNNVDCLSLQSANILLKTLEEPRRDVHFILISKNSYKIPRTVRSRTHEWWFMPLSSREIKEIAEGYLSRVKYPRQISVDELVVLSEGSMENVELFIEKIDLWQRVKGTLDEVLNGNIAIGLSFCSDVGRSKDDLPSIFHCMRVHCHNKMLGEKDKTKKLLWSIALSNVLCAERVIFERNISVQYALATLLVNLSSDGYFNPFVEEMPEESLIEKMII